MKSIKPGRGPSMMNGVMSIVGALFGVFWIVVASRLSGFMAIFGVLFVGIAIWQAVYHFKNATSKNRYSIYDITDGEEEPDPFAPAAPDAQPRDVRYCPYCGATAGEGFAYCAKCGKKLP